MSVVILLNQKLYLFSEQLQFAIVAVYYVQ